MVTGVGNDIVSVERIRKLLETDASLFINKVFTCREREDAGRHPVPLMYYSSRFSAKEAVFKCLRSDIDLRLNEIEIVSDDAGRPSAVLYGRVLELAAEKNITRIDLSISYDTGYAAAFAAASDD